MAYTCLLPNTVVRVFYVYDRVGPKFTNPDRWNLKLMD